MRRTRWSYRIAVLAVVPVLALGPAGCGSDGGLTAGGGKSPAADEEERLRRFAQCMRENGVEMEDPQDGRIRIEKRRDPGTRNDGQDEVNAAMEKCRSHMPDGGEPPRLSPEDQEKMRQYARCMRAHGIDMEDPAADGRITVRREKGGPGEEDYQKAERECRHHLPAPRRHGESR